MAPKTNFSDQEVKGAARHSLVAALILLLAAAGCVTADPDATPTPNPTLLAVEAMLTATRAAPTVTTTPVPTATVMVTPSATREIPVTGDRKLPGAVGELVQSRGQTLLVLSVSREPTAGRLKPAEGNEYINIEVVIEAAGETPLPYNPYFFQLVGPAEEQATQPAVDAAGTPLLDGILHPGEIARGFVAFEVPENLTSNLLLHYAPVDENGQPAVGSVWVDLGTNASSPAPVPQPARGWPGQPLVGLGVREEGSGIALEVQDLRVEQRLEGLVAGKGNQLVALQVAITNLTRDRAPFNPSYFRVKAQSGFEYLPAASPSEALLQPGTLNLGQGTRGIVVFEVPENTGPLVMTYQPTVLFEEFEPIQILIPLP